MAGSFVRPWPVGLADQLPAGVEAQNIERHVCLARGLDGLMGDTAVLRHRGELVVMTRANLTARYRPVALARGTQPELVRVSAWQHALQVVTADGVERRIDVPSFEVPALKALVGAPIAVKPGRAAAAAAATTGVGSPAGASAIEALDAAALARLVDEALADGRFDLAGRALERLARVAVGERGTYVVLAACVDRLARGEPEEAFFKLRAELAETATVPGVLSRVIGASLLQHGRLALAAGAFAAAATAGAKGDRALLARAEQLAAEAGVAQGGLERAILQATYEHYRDKVQRAPGDAAAQRALERFERLRERGVGLVSQAREALEPIVAGAVVEGGEAPAAEAEAGRSGRLKRLVVWVLVIGGGAALVRYCAEL